MPETKNGEGRAFKSSLHNQHTAFIFLHLLRLPPFFRPTVRILCSGKKFEKGSHRRIIFLAHLRRQIWAGRKSFFSVD